MRGARARGSQKDVKPARIFTIGHSTRSVDELVQMLLAWGVRELVDIRTVPRSRHNPQFNVDVLGRTLAPHGIHYRRIAALGGLRARHTQICPDDNGAWDNASFHNFADYALTDAFETGIRELLDVADRGTCAIMCAEAVWWRCHRRIIADHLVARGIPVVHITSPTRAEPAALTPFARVGKDHRLRYPRL
jgi:uncharacterized protein (DUF488 family)